MGWFIALCAIGTGVACVGAIGFVGYIIYKSFEDNQKYGNRPSDDEIIQEFVTYSDVKSEIQPEPTDKNTESETTVQDQEKSVTQPQDQLHGAQHTTIQNTNGNNQKQTSEACTMTSDIQEDGDAQTHNGAVPQDLRSVGGDTFITDETFSTNSTESVRSFSAISSTDTLSAKAVKIRTWYEMSDYERLNITCHVCDLQVSTFTLPCEHPYMCNVCAPTLFMLYDRCPKCRIKITDYQQAFS